MCLRQLRFAGVFEAVAIRKKGFPFRHTHAHFFEYFRPIAPNAVSLAERRSNTAKANAQKLLVTISGSGGLVPEAAGCRFGRTMVLYKVLHVDILHPGFVTVRFMCCGTLCDGELCPYPTRPRSTDR